MAEKKNELHTEYNELRLYTKIGKGLEKELEKDVLTFLNKMNAPDMTPIIPKIQTFATYISFKNTKNTKILAGATVVLAIATLVLAIKK